MTCRTNLRRIQLVIRNTTFSIGNSSCVKDTLCYTMSAGRRGCIPGSYKAVRPAAMSTCVRVSTVPCCLRCGSVHTSAAVIENEFGAVSIDEALVKENLSAARHPISGLKSSSGPNLLLLLLPASLRLRGASAAGGGDALRSVVCPRSHLPSSDLAC